MKLSYFDELKPMRFSLSETKQGPVEALTADGETDDCW